MRTFPGACTASLPWMACAIGVSLLLAGSAWAGPAISGTPGHQRAATDKPSLAELKAELDQGDKIAALHALQMALNQVADGATFMWKKNNGNLQGIIRPTNVFRNVDGQLCRHVVYVISLGDYRKQIELVACREAGGRWRL